MKTSNLTWPEAKNRLVVGVVKKVYYQNGSLASYRYISGKIATYYGGNFHSYRDPCNPWYGFRC